MHTFYAHTVSITIEAHVVRFLFFPLREEMLVFDIPIMFLPKNPVYLVLSASI